ncbi:MAG: hypothetical protein RSB42_09140 [Comamonas sp.]
MHLIEQLLQLKRQLFPFLLQVPQLPRQHHLLQIVHGMHRRQDMFLLHLLELLHDFWMMGVQCRQPGQQGARLFAQLLHEVDAVHLREDLLLVGRQDQQ